MQANEKILEEIDTHIWGLMPAQVPMAAGRLLPLLRKVVKPDTGHTPEGILQAMANGVLATWIIGDFKAFTCTEVQERETGRVLWNTWMAGDDLDEWIDDWMRVQEAFARHMNCTAIEFAGRKAYERKYMPTFNKFRAIRTVYRQEL